MAQGALSKLEPYDGVSSRGQSTASFTLKAGGTWRVRGDGLRRHEIFKILEVVEPGVDRVTGALADPEPHFVTALKLGKASWSRIILVRAQMVPAA